MLPAMRQSWLLFALFALVALTSALNLESLNMDGIESYIHHGKKRQAQGTGASTAPSSTPAPSSAPPPQSTEESTEPSSTPPPPPSSTPPPESSAPPPSSAPSSTPPPTSDPAPSSTKPTRVTAPVTKSTPLVSTEFSSYTTYITKTVDGSVTVETSIGTKTSLHTTGSHFETELPSPQQDGNSGDGLSSGKKSIIGGVVGGVGGALLLGGLAVVAWRIWGRKKRVSEDDDDLTFSTGSALGDKSSSPPASANTPFRSNLEQYHNPGGRPNAAANF